MDHAGTVGRQTAWGTPCGPAPAPAARPAPDGATVARTRPDRSSEPPSHAPPRRGPAAPTRGAPALAPRAPHARGAGHQAQAHLSTARHGRATALEHARQPSTPPPPCWLRRSVAARNHGHAAAMTAYDSDTGDGGTLPPPSARLPPHSRHAEPNACGEPPRHTTQALGTDCPWRGRLQCIVRGRMGRARRPRDAPLSACLPCACA